MVVPPSVGGTSSTTATIRASPGTGAPTTNNRTKTVPFTLVGNGYHPTPNMSTIPLSARRAQPLDMSSVERRGQPLEAREQIKRQRPMLLSEAPTFRPTEEEFRDPMEYMRKIAPEGRKYGIAKIIPPDGWNPDFAIDTEVRFNSHKADHLRPRTRAHDYLLALTNS